MTIDDVMEPTTLLRKGPQDSRQYCGGITMYCLVAHIQPVNFWTTATQAVEGVWWA